ncbi:hypothetical protein ABZW03_27070, partial [Kitasatospora sp. NPDC004799]|uniref:hypothetical protein n=1 Tax=Kitasatospora sp. NPDC004799 TaxID=3154460 RepID=UPI00339FF396
MTSVEPAASAPPDHGGEADSFPLLPARTAARSFRRASGEAVGGPELPVLLAALAAVLSRHNDLHRIRVAVPFVSNERTGLVTLRLDLGEEPTFARALDAADRALEQARRLTGPELAERLAEPAPACAVSALDR